MEQPFLDGDQLDTSNGMTTARESSRRGSKTASSLKPRSSVISGHSSVTGTPQAIRDWLMSSLSETPARAIQTLIEAADQQKVLEKRLLMSLESSGHCLCTGKTLPKSVRMLHGRRKELRNGLKLWAIPLRLLKCGRVVWGMTTDARGCSCKPGYPTPVATDYHGYRCGEHHASKGLKRLRLNHFLFLSGRPDLAHSPEFREELMGWPIGWTGLKPLATDRTHGQ
ncbi:MAG: hypothetical protein A4E62_01558 [Syntrophorhabdus sp. PtaU1.Bin002]|nr:MAG: hypothetical protein A4E62_01558 [Syntrophorhabdus sp. PtaU1.Bin002]